MSKATVYLIPTYLDPEALQPLPPYIADAIRSCQVFFVENERTARRYCKSLWREMVIDDYEWFTIHKAEEEVKAAFKRKLAEGKTIGLISEAGCPGVADPGQILTGVAHQMSAAVKPLVGPSSILLALMASGMNGQQFRFVGYLPVDSGGRAKAIRDLEADSQKYKSTQIFIETPYRNNQLIETLLQTCRPTTMLSISANLTGPAEYIRTLSIADWRALKNAPGNNSPAPPPVATPGTTPAGTSGTAPAPFPDLHKQPAIFCLLA